MVKKNLEKSFGPKTSKNVIFGSKMVKNEKFWSKKFFWSESIQNALKRILKQKSQNRKFFPV